MVELVWLGLYVLVYGLLHSLLASRRLKNWLQYRWPGAFAYYRLAYNLLAILLLIPLLWMLWNYPGEPLWRWQGGWALVAYLLQFLAFLGFLLSLRDYDLQHFLGLRQLAEPGSEEVLHIGRFHRFVRHPWYSFALLMLWCRDLNGAELVCFSLLSLYLVVGAYLEERKLLSTYGEAYSYYRNRVPGLIPWPGRWLSVKEAALLEQGRLDELSVPGTGKD